MRKLTFEGFLKQYVAELSGIQTVSVHKLADCKTENPRLKEPLFLYALAFNKVDLPHPFLPTIATFSLPFTSKFISSKIVSAP